MMFERSIPRVALLVVLVGCGSSEGIFRKDGFYNERHPYRVAYDQPSDSPLADRGWMVDNFENDDGEIEDEKLSPAYLTRLRLDEDDDGYAETMVSVPAYDLLLRNARHAGRIWVRTLPIPRELQDRELRVLALDFVDAVGASGSYTTGLSPELSHGRRMLATRVLKGDPVMINGNPAYEVTFEAADVDQVRFGDEPRYLRTRLLVLRPDFNYRTGDARFPTLVLIGYTNRAEDFARGSADFERFAGGFDVFSERDLVASRQDDLFECVDEERRTLAVYIDVTEDGRIAWADTAPGRGAAGRFERVPNEPCVLRALHGLRLRDKGYYRRLTVSLIRGMQARPKTGYVRMAPKPAQPAALSAR